MNRKTKLFVLFIFLIYLFLFIFSFKGVKSPGIFLTLLFSGIIFEIITIAIADFSGSSIKLTGGIIVNILASSLLSPAETMLIASASVLIPRLYRIRNLPLIKFIFNASQIGLSAFVASVLFRALSTGDPLWNIPVIFLIAFVYMFMNTFFMTTILWISSSTNLREAVSRTFSTPFFSMMTLLPVCAVVYISYFYIGFVAIPLSLALVLSIQIGNSYKRKYEDLRIENLRSLAKSLEEKDFYTRGHSERVAEIARKIAHKMNLPSRLVERIYIAALLHDIGKVGIPDYVLNKPTTLTKEEFEIVKQHPIKGEAILKEIGRFRFKEAKWVRHHHERWDGKGYPDGLKGEEIPLPSRIIAVADVYEAMVSDRPYRKALSKEEVMKQLREMKGTALDPQIVDILLEIIEEEGK